jgi:hypothetical protein
MHGMDRGHPIKKRMFSLIGDGDKGESRSSEKEPQNIIIWLCMCVCVRVSADGSWEKKRWWEGSVAVYVRK